MSRSSLTNWAGRAVDLLGPVAAAQAAHILEGSVVAMDETSIKAGRAAPGRMRGAYFWPVFGEDGEIAFHYAPSRAHRHVDEFLGNYRGTLLSDGYAAYEAYAKRQGIGVIQSLLATCKLQGVDPYAYLVNVLQRVGQHPAKRAVELTPRVWKTLFADRPLRSDLDRTKDPPLQ